MIDTLITTYKINGLQDPDFMLTVALSVDIILRTRSIQQIKQRFKCVCQTFDTTKLPAQNQHKFNKGSFLLRDGSFLLERNAICIVI